MAAAVAHNGFMAPKANLSAKALGTDINVPHQPPIIDEDESSLSSAGTDLFDHSSNNSSQRERWRLDTSGKWQRFGSLESAASTGISSLCSSVAADDIRNSRVDVSSPSKKRMADGNLKISSPTSATTPETAIFSQAAPLQLSTSDSQPPQKMPKKRGRPPKPKGLVTDVSEQPIHSTTPKLGRPPKVHKVESKARPRASIPSRLPATEYASQCIEAAFASRLNPYALHPGEHRLLVDRLTSKEVTIYLNIRNSILRLWQENPICTISADEAAGCAKETRFFGLADVAYKWLMRNGYINFGCVSMQHDHAMPRRFSKDARQRTVVVVGAGVSGLTTARQLENFFKAEAPKWTNMGERPPRVIVLEGRKRIGGRVYSKPLRSQVRGSLPDGLRNTAEMGAMIVTGFEHGNPLNTIIRGQLGLRYHLMRDALTIYDCDGRPIGEERDMLNTELYTDISERAGEYRAEPHKKETLKGDEDLINRCRDPVDDGSSAFQLEPLPEAHIKAHRPSARRGRRRNAPPGTEKLTGRSQVVEGGSATHSAVRAVKEMGWQVRDGIAKNQSVSLHKIADAGDYPTLGSVMDEAIVQYQDLIDLSPLDMRLLNWHHANLEYANAAPVSQLSLSGHDQDTGNEFEGAHSEVVGGYTQLPRGLMNLPTKLDVRFDRIVDSIHYDQNPDTEGAVVTKVVCTGGEVIEADEVVMTAPLGVLKSNTIDFDPPLPRWKQGAIDRMGFGLLNKVILLYDRPFWDDDRDMFGLLNEAEKRASLDPSDYARRRGRFYLIWNCSKISGRPMLIALMAGNAAHDAEWTSTSTLMTEVTNRLRTVFPKRHVPPPLEVIVTRWKRDPFSRGTYSYVGPETRPADYDLMARSVGNLHFAGEATCGTHPATVHGALLSGLRAASDVMDRMAGTIDLPSPLIEAGPVKEESMASDTRPGLPPVQPLLDVQAQQALLSAVAGDTETAMQHALDPLAPYIKQEESTVPLNSIPMSSLAPAPAQKKSAGPPAQSVCATDPSFWVSPSFDASDLDYEAAVISVILGQIGERPVKPARPGVNPFLLFTKEKWDECKDYCHTHHPHTSNERNLIRTTIGKWWRALGEEEKRPYQVQSQTAQELADAVRNDWETNVARWDEEAARIRKEFAREHPPPMKAMGAGSGSGNGVSKRKTNVSNCVVLDHL